MVGSSGLTCVRKYGQEILVASLEVEAFQITRGVPVNANIYVLLSRSADVLGHSECDDFPTGAENGNAVYYATW